MIDHISFIGARGQLEAPTIRRCVSHVYCGHFKQLLGAPGVTVCVWGARSSAAENLLYMPSEAVIEDRVQNHIDGGVHDEEQMAGRY